MVQPASEEKRALEVVEVSKSFKGKPALVDVSLRVKKGEIFGVIGPDGAGKSTLFKVIAGVLKPDAGRVSVSGELSFMPQGIGQNLYMDLTVEENIRFFAEIKGRGFSEDFMLRLLEVAGLLPFRNRPAGRLSGGMQQKLGLCCCLISRPDVLLLDEPTTGVDPVSRREIWDLLYGFAEEGVTIFLSTSYVTEAERCHRIALMHGGRVISVVDTEELAEKGVSVDELFKEFLRGERRAFRIFFSGKKEFPGVGVFQLTKRFGDFTAVNNVSFFVHPGEIFGLLGPNGAGKTTTIKMMVGLLKPTSGKVKMVPKREIGYMSQRFSLYRDLTVAENIEFFASLYGVDPDLVPALKDWVLEISDLKGLEGELVSELPVGMRQRLSLGCSLMHFPSVLFLDEPTSGVDPAGRDLFWSIIKRLSREHGISVIVTTHHLIEAHYCDRLALMNSGRIVALGSPSELVEEAESLQGKAYRIYGRDVGKARRFLAERGLYVYTFGRSLRVWDKVGLSELRELLRGFSVSVEPAELGMEDVFVLFSKKAGSLCHSREGV